MRKLQKPTYDAIHVFRICISHVRNAALKGRLQSIEANIQIAAAEFEVAATSAVLHTLRSENDVRGVVTKDEMVEVYKQRMAKKNTPGRPFYDLLLAAPAHGRCPLCAQRTVSTLDHHLPKEFFPALAVVPSNLVPACKDCNNIKLSSLPHTEVEQTLHPYFDNVDVDPWLCAEVIEGTPAALRFFAAPPANWNHVIAERVKYHFEVFQLAKLYASHSAEELTNIHYSLDLLRARGGSEAVKSHLQEQALSRELAHKNSWQTAMYKALAVSDWFCGGGFR